MLQHNHLHPPLPLPPTRSQPTRLRIETTKQKQKTQNVYTLEYNKQRIDLKKYKKIILLYTFIVSSNSLNFQQNRVKIGHKSVTNS